jgi:hypothetical protein
MAADTGMYCATHPDVETALGCSRCGKPICGRCLVHTPVGARCMECAQVKKVPTYNVQKGTLGRAIAAGAGAGIAVGLLWGFFNPLTYFFFGIIAGLAVGYGIGEIISVATNRRAGQQLQSIAVGAVLLAYCVRVGVLMTVGTWAIDNVQRDLIGLLATLVAAFIAAGRLR